MKILITTDWYSPTVNGVVTSVLNLEKNLRRLGHEVRVLTLSEKMRSYKSGSTYRSRSVSAFIYPEARISLTKHSYYKELIDWKPDIIHTQCEFSTYLTARKIARKLNIPIVHTYHTVYEDYTHYFCPSKKLGKAMASTLTRRLLKPADKIIVPTEKVKELLVKYGVNKEVCILPTGIDTEKFAEPLPENEKGALKKKYNIPEGNIVMLFLGRLAKEKNTGELIENFKALNAKKLTLLIVGGGPYYKELKKETEKICGGMSVIFTGMVPPDEVGKYYKLGDFFVSASTSETQGLTYAEALANGLPSLCKRDPCIDGVVIDNYNGFQYETVEEFKTYAKKLAEDSAFRKQLSENAVKTAEKFSTLTFAKMAEKIYAETIKEYKSKLL
ncbi:MAG: glycosyltransferase family 4 protein [Clostridiales bacterium]|nr:glycosyltransferase family 4 protein [Clostridiales bacterium]